MENSAVDSDYRAALRFLLDRINYERNPAAAQTMRNFKLDRMGKLLAELGNPQEGVPVVHVAGTKGKGSTASMLASILCHAGLRTGLYTSPHLNQLEERFQINGENCTQHELITLVDQLRPVVKTLEGQESSSPTYFELTTAIAWLHFATSSVDIAVVEVGMGGRLDSTNICQPLISVITSISLDHTAQLGNTLAEIAVEKAGIVKSGVPVISGVTQNEPREVIQQVVQHRHAPLFSLNQHFAFETPDRSASKLSNPTDFPSGLSDSAAAATTFTYQDLCDPNHGSLRDLSVPLLGTHQAANASLAVAAIRQLQDQGWQIHDHHIRAGLYNVSCPARVEILSKHPMVIVDTAHNLASAIALDQTLAEHFPTPASSILIFSTSQDKDAAGMLQALLPRFDHCIVTRYRNNPRALPAEKLLKTIELLRERAGHGALPEVHMTATPIDAWQTAQDLATRSDLICVTGSFFIAAEIRQLLTNASATTAHKASSPHATDR
ncbi:MAG: folylpolyglutamate synthase/dihydrofolate synthase family protein [Planctomycetota bacterium]|nr:folylpolyglutamate synthase/dihydrofolate synthase family protein [Planctomycetota bacterium]